MSKSTQSGIRRLVFCSSVVVLLWCIVLPRLSRQPANQRYIEFLEQRGIDPSAMYYTELDCMDEVLDSLNVR